MGLFILPGRLKNELKQLEPYLTGTQPLVAPQEGEVTYKHWPWVQDIVNRRGTCSSTEEAEQILAQFPEHEFLMALTQELLRREK